MDGGIMMNEEQKAHIKEILQEEKQDLEEAIHLMNENGPKGSLLEWTDELSAYDNHPSDLAAETFEMEKIMALVVHEEELLREVNEALERADTEGFGVCDRCGKEIAYERLEAIPYARECMKCATEDHVPFDSVMDGRPKEEAVLRNGLGERFLDRELDEGDDGLGIFRQLQTFGSADNMQDIGNVKDYHDINELYNKMGDVDPIDTLTYKDYEDQLPE